MLAAKDHRAKPYPGRAVVTTGDPHDEVAWRRRLTGDMCAETVDGEYSALMREPHVGAVARVLLQELDASVRDRAAV